MREFAFHELSLFLGDLVYFVEHVQTWDIHPIACGRNSAHAHACEQMTRAESGEDNENHCRRDGNRQEGDAGVRDGSLRHL